MKNCIGKKETKDIKGLKNYLSNQGFVCNSHPSAQQLIYSKDNDVIIIKNVDR